MVRIGPRALIYIESLGNCYHQHSIYMLSKQSTCTMLILCLFHSSTRNTRRKHPLEYTVYVRVLTIQSVSSKDLSRQAEWTESVFHAHHNWWSGRTLLIDIHVKQTGFWTKWWGCPALLISLYISHGHGYLLCTVTR